MRLCAGIVCHDVRGGYSWFGSGLVCRVVGSLGAFFGVRHPVWEGAGEVVFRPPVA